MLVEYLYIISYTCKAKDYFGNDKDIVVCIF